MGITLTQVYTFLKDKSADNSLAASFRQTMEKDPLFLSVTDGEKAAKELSLSADSIVLFFHLFDSDFILLNLYQNGRVIASYDGSSERSKNLSKIPALFGFDHCPKTRLPNILKDAELCAEEKAVLLEEYFGIPLLPHDDGVTVERGDEKYRAYLQQKRIQSKSDQIPIVYGDLISLMITEDAKLSLNQFVQCFKERYQGRVLEVQLYETFYRSDDTYPFIEGTIVYYPLSVVLKDGSCEMVWVEWDCAALQNIAIIFYAYPFAVKSRTWGKPIVLPLRISDTVPERFLQEIAGKKLFYIRPKGSMRMGIYTIFPPPRDFGQYCTQSFADECGRQIFEEIRQATGVKKFSHWWDMRIWAQYGTERIGSTRYLLADIGDAYTARHFCIQWETIEWTENLTDKQVKFSISDECPFKNVVYEILQKEELYQYILCQVRN